ncbi:MAG: glycosyl hydrolase family 18 protein [Prevotella sp.]|nr:glycosyl hydrolase family 18 protein [Staphylococcus sp.]MCM1350274.1 glycosyl hydrolase family 18 protein [Prevotella sp.]
MKKSLVCCGLFVLLFLSLVACKTEHNPSKTEEQIKVEQLIERIDAISIPIVLSSATTLKRLKEEYDALSDEAKRQVTNSTKLFEALQEIARLEDVEEQKRLASEVVDLIERLKSVEEITLEDEKDIVEARTAYDALSAQAKEYVHNIEKLDKLELKLNDLQEEARLHELASLVSQKLKDLPNVEDLTLDHQDQVSDARQAYEALDFEAKSYVVGLSTLEALEEKLEVLQKEAQQNEWKARAQAVDDCIIALPTITELQLHDQEKVQDARAQYEALEDEAKSYVNQIELLIVLENQLKKLQQEQQWQEEASGVVQSIQNLPTVDTLTLADKEQVEQVSLDYEALSQAAKSYVTNVDKLNQLKQKLLQLEEENTFQQSAAIVDASILALPSIEELTLVDEQVVMEVRNAYEALPEAAKGYVAYYNMLLELETKMEQLKEEQDVSCYDVYFYLDGGTLEGTTQGREPQKNASFSTNYYSTGYWAHYTNEVVVFKTSKIGEADTYASALKIGFSYQNASQTYIVDQVIASGVGLYAGTKTSDYFIFVHPEYAVAYQMLSTVEVGDRVVANQAFGDVPSTTCGLSIEIYDAHLTIPASYVIKQYTSTATLANPTKSGYIFMGWYTNPECTGTKVTTVSKSVTLYACWKMDDTQINPSDILNLVSDIATSQTIDYLPATLDGATFEWSSSHPELYQIENGIGKVSKINQTHKAQQVTITVKIHYANGTTQVKSKPITIDPILFDDLVSTPVATYFSTSAMYAYKQYNDRYKQEGTLFSNTTKEALDIIYYAFITINADGTCQLDNTSYLNEVRALRENGVRIVASVNGVSSQSCTYLMNLTADATKRATFVKNLMDLVERYNLDGLDIDWETVSSTVKVVASSMNALCKDLRAEMNKRQDDRGTPYFLSAAVPASSWGTASDRFDFKTLDQYLDYINIMSYDMNRTDKTSHLSPMYSSSYDGGYGFGCAYGVERLVSLGFSRNKLIIGTAGYGKAFKVTGTSSNTTYPYLGVAGTLTQISGVPGSFASGTVFGNGIQYLLQTGKYTKYTEFNKNGQIVGSYLYNATDRIFVTYDSEEVVKAKYAYANSMDGVGIMCWCYSEDTADNVINAIYASIHR